MELTREQLDYLKGELTRAETEQVISSGRILLLESKVSGALEEMSVSPAIYSGMDTNIGVSPYIYALKGLVKRAKVNNSDIDYIGATNNYIKALHSVRGFFRESSCILDNDVYNTLNTTSELAYLDTESMKVIYYMDLSISELISSYRLDTFFYALSDIIPDARGIVENGFNMLKNIGSKDQIRGTLPLLNGYNSLLTNSIYAPYGFHSENNTTITIREFITKFANRAHFTKEIKRHIEYVNSSIPEMRVDGIEHQIRPWQFVRNMNARTKLLEDMESLILLMMFSNILFKLE